MSIKISLNTRDVNCSLHIIYLRHCRNTYTRKQTETGYQKARKQGLTTIDNINTYNVYTNRIKVGFLFRTQMSLKAAKGFAFDQNKQNLDRALDVVRGNLKTSIKGKIRKNNGMLMQKSLPTSKCEETYIESTCQNRQMGCHKLNLTCGSHWNSLTFTIRIASNSSNKIAGICVHCLQT